MSYYEFKVSLPLNKTKIYRFQDLDVTEERRKELLEVDSRFNPTAIKLMEVDSKAIIVDTSNNLISHDTSHLIFIGKRNIEKSSGKETQEWYSSFENRLEVKKEFEKKAALDISEGKKNKGWPKIKFR